MGVVALPLWTREAWKKWRANATGSSKISTGDCAFRCRGCYPRARDHLINADDWIDTCFCKFKMVWAGASGDASSKGAAMGGIVHTHWRSKHTVLTCFTSL